MHHYVKRHFITQYGGMLYYIKNEIKKILHSEKLKNQSHF